MKKHTKFKGFAAGVVVALAGSLFSIQVNAAEYMLCANKEKKLSVGGTDNPVFCEMKYNNGNLTASIIKPLSELNGEGWKVVSMTQSTAYQVMFLLIKE